MRSLRVLGLACLAVVVTAAMAAAPAQAGPAGKGSYAISGVMAQADWAPMDLPVGETGITVRLLRVAGSDAVATERAAGQKPVTYRQPSLLAMAATVPTDAGPVDAEIWCIGEEESGGQATFTYAKALDSARLDLTCEALVLTGEGDTDTGERLTLSATVTWAANGSTILQRNHDVYTEDGVRTLDRARVLTQPCDVHIEVTFPSGDVLVGDVGPFEGKEQPNGIASLRASGMYRQS